MTMINLEFKKDITKLAGNPLGRKVYDEQVKDIIHFDDKICIVFPKNIDRIASSFVQGFFKEIVDEIGIVGIFEKIEVVAESIPDVQSFVFENLE